MQRRTKPWMVVPLSAIPLIVGFSGQTTPQDPTAEQVFKNIKVFKGLPASELIPAMQFMSASLHFECEGCHNPQDFSADNKVKEDARKMVLMQRDINTRHFENKLEVTCMSCHNGKGHPTTTPLPANVPAQPVPMTDPPKPESVMQKYLAAVGDTASAIVRTGTLTAKDDITHNIETKPAEFVQTTSSKFEVKSGMRRFNSDGAHVWYMGNPLDGEPAAVFQRLGRSWRGPQAFAGLVSPKVVGKSTIGSATVVVLRANRPSTVSTEALYFDQKSGLLLRMVNYRKSPIGTNVISYDYSDYRSINGIKVPMRIVTTFGDNSKWTLTFNNAKLITTIDESAFRP